MSYEGLQAEVVPFKGHNGDTGEAYYARPTKAGKVPGMVVIMHLPGWDEWIIEVTRKFAHHGYAAISPHLYFREGPGSPDDVGARVRAAGGVADAQVVGDVDGVDRLSAGAAQFQRQGRRHRLLLGRPARLSRRLQRSRHRRGGRLLGRQRRGRRSGEAARRPQAGRADRPHRRS